MTHTGGAVGWSAAWRSLAEVDVAFGGSYHFLVGPTVATVVVLVLVLLSRWTFGPSRRQPTRHRPPDGPVDYGLLVPIARVGGANPARDLARRLEEGGIRGTVARSADGTAYDVLVFPRDVQRARELVR